MNKNYGEYPYKQYSIIQGGDGGMEYPMCTLITARGRSKVWLVLLFTNLFIAGFKDC